MKKNQQNRNNSGNMTAEKTSGVKTFFTMLRKLLVTVIMVCIFAGIILTVSAVSYVIGIANEPLGIDNIRPFTTRKTVYGLISTKYPKP